MSVKVLIKRRFKNANSRNVSKVIVESRKHAMAENGYISSETLCSSDDPNLILVLSTWKERENWDNYMNSPIRKQTEEKYVDLFARPTSYEFYNLGLPFALSDNDFDEPLEF